MIHNMQRIVEAPSSKYAVVLAHVGLAQNPHTSASQIGPSTPARQLQQQQIKSHHRQALTMTKVCMKLKFKSH